MFWQEIEMWGQWEGNTVDQQWNTVDQQWHVLLNIDRDRQTEARLLFCDLQQHTKWRHAKITKLSVENSAFHADTEFSSPYPFNLAADPDQKSEPHETILGQIEGTLDGDQLCARLTSAKEAWNISGVVRLGRIETETPTQPHHRFTWSEFAAWISALTSPYGQLIFRGHEKATYRLTTSLHRTGRRDLIRYRAEDLNLLKSYVSGINGKRYQLTDLDDYHNLLSLAQHHGYPTPLLDWSESPFVAAYFALRNASQAVEIDKVDCCRIFAFDVDLYQQEAGADLGALEVPFLSLHGVRSGFRDNDRAIPQQSIFVLSNVVDIEGYIEKVEAALKKRVMTKIDLPVSEARIALNALRLTGITEASLFPGLDGMCKELRSRFFS